MTFVTKDRRILKVIYHCQRQSVLIVLTWLDFHHCQHCKAGGSCKVVFCFPGTGSGTSPKLLKLNTGTEHYTVRAHPLSVRPYIYASKEGSDIHHGLSTSWIITMLSHSDLALPILGHLLHVWRTVAPFSIASEILGAPFSTYKAKA